MNYSDYSSPDSLIIQKIISEQEWVIDYINSSIATNFRSKVRIFLYNLDEAKEKIGTNGGGFASSSKIYPKIEYLIVGEGPLKKELEELARRLDLKDCIHFLGEKDQSQLKTIYKYSDVFMLSSVIGKDGAQEGQGLVFLEAQAMGIPVVSTNTGGIPETVLDKKSGFLVPERDIDALADKLISLVGNRSLRTEMGSAGQKFVKKHFNIDNFNNQLAEIYTKLQKNRL